MGEAVPVIWKLEGGDYIAYVTELHFEVRTPHESIMRATVEWFLGRRGSTPQWYNFDDSLREVNADRTDATTKPIYGEDEDD